MTTLDLKLQFQSHQESKQSMLYSLCHLAVGEEVSSQADNCLVGVVA